MTISRRDALRLGALAMTAIGTGLPGAAAAATRAYPFTLGNAEIGVHPISHASLALTLPGLVVYADPVGEAALYADLPAPDLILVTHEHGDHFNVEMLTALAGDATTLVTNPAVFDKLPAALQAKATKIANGEATTAGGLKIDAVPAYNTTGDRLQYHPQGRDNGYVLTLEGGRIYIAGDTEDIPEMATLSGIDIAFLPMNLPYTMDIEQAARAAASFAPKTVFPYHYRGSDIAAFAALVAANGSGSTVIEHDWYA